MLTDAVDIYINQGDDKGKGSEDKQGKRAAATCNFGELYTGRYSIGFTCPTATYFGHIDSFYIVSVSIDCAMFLHPIKTSVSSNIHILKMKMQSIVFQN